MSEDKRKNNVGNPNWKKGQSGNPAGRPKGSKNKVQSELRWAFTELQERQFENVEKWLAETAAEDPAKALDLYLKMTEYIMPKLARTENVHEVDDKTISQINIEIKKSKD